MKLRMAMCLLLAAALAGSAAGQGPAAKPLREVADTDIDRAILEAKRYLYGQMTDTGLLRRNWIVPFGGETAIGLLALLEAGESPNDPRIKKSLTALAAVKTNNLYVIATRAMVLAQVAGLPEYRKQLLADVKYLAAGAQRHGAWGYGGPQRDGDNSCSQFALLALWEADRAGVKLAPALIRQVERVWLRRQRRDGGWTYSGAAQVKTDSTLTMTTAALASLHICQDVLAGGCAPYRNQKAIDRGWGFLAAGLKDDYYTNGYLAFCVQRVGLTTGRKFIGEMDWFAAAAAKLCEANPRGRSYKGQWGNSIRAAFELIFLARGRIPLTFNKLRHGDERDWNLHSRDVAHFAEYMRRGFERRMRWQIVRISDEVQRMLDAPILLVAGAAAPQFTLDEWAKLREYSLRGGTLLFVPTHRSKPFTEAVRKQLADLYARQRERAGGGYELAKLPADHPIYTGYVEAPAGDKAAPMWGVSDGTRLLAILSDSDIACTWHRQATGQKLDYALGVNLFMYATGANPLRMRLRPVFVGSTGQARHRAKVAWLKHGGNWCTQPFALKYLSRKLTAENRVAIELSEAAAISAEGLAGQDLAWMTGSAKFELTQEQFAALGEWLDGGGTLFVNAVGGADDFNESAAAMLEKLFAGRQASAGFVASSSPLMTGKCGDFRGPPLEDLLRTKILIKASPRPQPPLRVYVEGERVVAVHARYGIHDTLDGHTTWSAKSYMPTAARDIAANIVLYALSRRVK